MKLKLDKDEYIYPCQKGYCVTYDDGKETPFLQWFGFTKFNAQKKHEKDKKEMEKLGFDYSDMKPIKIIKVVLTAYDWEGE